MQLYVITAGHASRNTTSIEIAREVIGWVFHSKPKCGPSNGAEKFSSEPANSAAAPENSVLKPKISVLKPKNSVLKK